MKFFLDNNLSPRLAKALEQVVLEHEFTHLRDKFPASTEDKVWLRKLGDEGNWIIISGDMKITRNPHELQAWNESGLTAFFLTKAWHSLKLIEKTSKFLHRFEDIAYAASRCTPGTGFKLRLKGKIIELK